MAGRSWSGLSHPFMRPAGRPGISLVLDDRLLVGEYLTPDDIAWVRSEHGIDAVLSLQEDADLAYKGVDRRRLEQAYADASVALHRFPVTDGDTADLADSLPRIVDTLHGLLEAGLRVYVHCNAGFNRAPTVAIAYLHVHHGLSIGEAHDLVKSKRACAPYLTSINTAYRRDEPDEPDEPDGTGG